ncbi:MAG: hypothetical protein MUO42_09880 [Anaerolineaceae bacterium]|nr:hypothetical protein [Anaerolineaceae bacterium]
MKICDGLLKGGDNAFKIINDLVQVIINLVYKKEMQRYCEISNQKLEIKRVKENGKEVLISQCPDFSFTGLVYMKHSHYEFNL